MARLSPALRLLTGPLGAFALVAAWLFVGGPSLAAAGTWSTPTVLKVQKPTKGAALPKRIALNSRTVLSPKNPRTNAGQRLRTAVACLPVTARAAGEVRACVIRRSGNGKVVLRTFGVVPPRIVVVQTAPAADGYQRYRARTEYRNGAR